MISNNTIIENILSEFSNKTNSDIRDIKLFEMLIRLY